MMTNTNVIYKLLFFFEKKKTIHFVVIDSAAIDLKKSTKQTQLMMLNLATPNKLVFIICFDLSLYFV